VHGQARDGQQGSQVRLLPLLLLRIAWSGLDDGREVADAVHRVAGQ